jgi:uncharacterized protein (DUF58 family)
VGLIGDNFDRSASVRLAPWVGGSASEDVAGVPPASATATAPRRFTWRGRAILLFSIGGFALVGGLAFRASDALLFSVPLLLAPVSTWLLLPRASTVVQAVGECRDKADGLELSIELRAQPPLPSGALEVEIEVPSGTTAPDGASRRVLLRPGETPRTSFFLRPHRPLFAELAPPKVRWRDPLGLGELQLPVVGRGLTLERDLPGVRHVPRLALQRTTMLPGEVRSRRTGSSGDFASIRPFAPGDSRRRINWWATARRNELLSNEFLPERSGELVIVLDARNHHLPYSDDAELLGVGRAAALGLARSFLREKTRIGLAVFGEFADCLPLGSGKLHGFRIERMLEKVRLADVEPPIERLSVGLRRYYRSGTPILYMTPMADDETVAAGYHLRRRGFPCLLLTPSPVTLEGERMDLASEDGKLALRLFRLERRVRLRQAWESAPVVEWEDFTSLAALVGFLRRPPTSMRGGRA